MKTKYEELIEQFNKTDLEEQKERYRQLSSFWNGNVSLAKREQYNQIINLHQKLDIIIQLLTDLLNK